MMFWIRCLKSGLDWMMLLIGDELMAIKMIAWFWASLIGPAQLGRLKIERPKWFWHLYLVEGWTQMVVTVKGPYPLFVSQRTSTNVRN